MSRTELAVLFATAAARVVGCNAGAGLPASVTIDEPPYTAPLSNGERPGPTKDGDAVKALCSIRMVDICKAPDTAGAFVLCGKGLLPSVGQRFLLYDEHRVLFDAGSATVAGELEDLGSAGFRAVAKIGAGWSAAERSPLGAIGPWDDTLGLVGGTHAWGEVVEDLGVWRVSHTFTFSGGVRLEVRKMLRSCDLFVTETRVLHAGRSCVTEIRTGPPEVGYVNLPRRCARRGSMDAP